MSSVNDGCFKLLGGDADAVRCSDIHRLARVMNIMKLEGLCLREAYIGSFHSQYAHIHGEDLGLDPILEI